jgi:hypothetical protein
MCFVNVTSLSVLLKKQIRHQLAAMKRNFYPTKSMRLVTSFSKGNNQKPICDKRNLKKKF